MEIKILYQDEWFVIVHKPALMQVHPQGRFGDPSDQTLMMILKKQIDRWLYPVHRLDRAVSGIVMFGLEKESIRQIQKVWHADETEKKYMAMVKGEITETGQFDFPLKNDQKVEEECLTLYKPLLNFNGYTLCDINLRTGRKHQIRRHFSRRMHPLIGDTQYGQGKINRFFRDEYNFRRVFLHKYYFKIKHPFKDEFLKIRCPLDQQLIDLMDKMIDLKNPLQIEPGQDNQ